MVLPDTPLCIHLGSPFLHRFFRSESDDEILNSRITFPEDLASIRTYECEQTNKPV